MWKIYEIKILVFIKIILEHSYTGWFAYFLSLTVFMGQQNQVAAVAETDL